MQRHLSKKTAKNQDNPRIRQASRKFSSSRVLVYQLAAGDQHPEMRAEVPSCDFVARRPRSAWKNLGNRAMRGSTKGPVLSVSPSDLMEAAPEGFEERLKQILNHGAVLCDDQDVSGHPGDEFDIWG